MLERDQGFGDVQKNEYKKLISLIESTKDIPYDPNVIRLLSTPVIERNGVKKRALELEYFDGAPLDKTKVKPTNLIDNLVRGLSFIHGHNIVHGDFSPKNILVSEKDAIKISE